MSSKVSNGSCAGDGAMERAEPSVAPVAAPASRSVAVAELALAAAAAGALALVPLAAWLRWGGPGLASAGAAYAVVVAAASVRLARARRPAAAGVLAAAAALMAPCAVHGLEHVLDFLPRTSVSPRTLGELLRHPAFAVDLSAVASLALALAAVPFPPLAALLTGAIALVAVDAAPVVLGSDVAWGARAGVIAAVGALALAAGTVSDRLGRRAFGTSFHAAGLALVCGAMATFQAPRADAAALEVMVVASLLVTGLLLRRRMFAVFALVALAGEAGRLAGAVLDGAAFVAAAGGIALACGLAVARWPALEARLEASGARRGRRPSR